MRTLQRKNRPGLPADASPSVESLLAAVRTVWNTADAASDREKADELKKEITQTFNRLKTRIESRLGKSVAATAKGPLLFDDSDQQTEVVPPLPRFREPVLRVCSKDLANHALQHLPYAVKYHRVEDFRDYLTEKLRFNSQATRRRAASYIVSRFFPGDVYNEDLPHFAAAAEGTPALGEALFYLTCRTEKIISLVAEEVVFPSLVQGGVSRSRIRQYVQSTFPKSKSANQVGQSIVRTYELYGIARPGRTHLNVSLREGSLSSFTYLLHLEYPEPGMHAFENLLTGQLHKWLLWDQQWMIRQLYRLRDAGLLSKVSEIDRLRQFTTRYSLADAVPRIVEMARESQK